MKAVSLALLTLAGAWQTAARAGPPARWLLPRDREVCLMEDDLVYARFLTLERGGSYRQINRDENGSREVDRGEWQQDPTGTLRLRSTCHAMRPRAVSGGPLSVALTGERPFDDLSLLLTSLRQFLAANLDTVFSAASMSELNKAGAPVVCLGDGAQIFDRCDAVLLSARLEAALESERTNTYFLEPVKETAGTVFALRGSVLGASELSWVRQAYRIADGKNPPFYFTWIEAKKYVAEVGRWQPLHLPGGNQ